MTAPRFLDGNTDKRERKEMAKNGRYVEERIVQRADHSDRKSNPMMLPLVAGMLSVFEEEKHSEYPTRFST